MKYRKLDLTKKKEEKLDDLFLNEEDLTEVKSTSEGEFHTGHEDHLLAVRNGGRFKKRGFFLNDALYDWVIGRDDVNLLVLIPVSKGKV